MTGELNELRRLREQFTADKPLARSKPIPPGSWDAN
jgi:hypothetical protein